MRNNKGKKIIKPAGSELMDYLNRATQSAISAERSWIEEEILKADVIFTPARPVDGKLMRWIMSTRMVMKWNSYWMKEVMTA